MMMPRVTVATLLLGLAQQACATTISCPESIEVHESLAVAAPAGWQAQTQPSPHNVGGVTFFDGEPSAQQSLAPDHDVKSGKDRLATWTFTPAAASPIWLSCRYLDTGVSLAQPLPAATHQCKVRYGAGSIVKSIDCESR